jgi:endopeptidase La
MSKHSKKNHNKSISTCNRDINIKNQIIKLQEIVKKTILAVNQYKTMDVFGASELQLCIHSLETIFINLSKLLKIIKEPYNENEIINSIQELTSEISTLFRTFGTNNIDDLLFVCFGKDFLSQNILSKKDCNKLEIMKKYLHPFGYNVIPWKNTPNSSSQSSKPLRKNRIVEDFMIVQQAVNLECFDLSRNSRSFQTKVYGLKFAIQNYEEKKTLIISCLVDDLMTDCLNYDYIIDRIADINNNIPHDNEFNNESFKRYIEALTLKELLVYNNEEIYDRYTGYINQIHLMKQKTIGQVTKEFLANDLYGQRSTLIQLLIRSNEHEYQYLSYLLYDLLTNDNNGNIDTQEQTLLFDSLPWNVKKYFRDAMKQTINYTNNLANFDNNKIPLEQQICLMKVNDTIKEKAMVKLKEVKSKSEDSGSKARQYLEGLLRIPFGIYKEEPILNITNENLQIFNDLIQDINNNNNNNINLFPYKNKYSSIEMRKYLPLLKSKYYNILKLDFINNLKHSLINNKRNMLIVNICYINELIKTNNIKYPKLCHSGKKTLYMQEHISNFIDDNQNNLDLLLLIYQKCNINNNNYKLIKQINSSVSIIEQKNLYINNFMDNITEILDNAVHGHEKAKRQIERIIGQWINGEKSGYCFGFEGPPGLGKTSLAKKGISNCLKDENNISRPFSFIAIGGSSNGSTLDGHNYTYVGSTWGRIVDILMEKKCMNPIIFIDELDKVSNTEHGKELIGILTHLIDPTQNDDFQDKYFNGISLDLSKALFIFSYNDVNLIDRILLDRIHRIKFDHLSLEDKLTITKNYLFPEIYKNMGLDGVINISDSVIEYIIEKYTSEPGVRKLKELLFEIVGEINLSILKNNTLDYDIPINITEDDIKYKYLKNKNEIVQYKVQENSEVGLINGLWANALGKGGVLPIEIKYFPSTNMLDLKLTGMQGDVMKESMTVAKTLAWSLLDFETIKVLQKQFDKTKNQGIHIHVPEGATPKDGPSAGTAITVVIYSLLKQKKILSNIAITGEISLQGKVTAIGGLDLKILGGIRAGVKTFIYPKDNNKDFIEFKEKYNNKDILKDIKFIEVNNIHQVLDIVFDDN